MATAAVETADQVEAVDIVPAKKAREEWITIYLQGTPNLKVRMPFEEARKHLGVKGYHVRPKPPLKVLFALGGMVLFGVMMGWYAWLLFHDTGQVALWAGMGTVMGGLMGFFAGLILQSGFTTHIYTAWSWWDAAKKERVIEPMEHMPAVNMMGELSPAERMAFLVRIGEARPPTQTGRGSTTNGQREEAPSSSFDDASTSHIQGSYSPRRLFVVLEGRLYQRVIAGRRGFERAMQMASMGTIAVSVLIITAIIVLVMTDDTGPGTSTPPPPGVEVPGQDVKR